MLLAVDKPTGMTSYDVIRRLKTIFPKKTKIGHSGTLDPLATGLLLIGVHREGTKLLHELQGLDKSYTTTIDFSKMSDTWDIDYWEKYEEYELAKDTPGITKNNTFVPAPPLSLIEEKLAGLIPEAELPLTPFSAKKKDGKKLYELARQGELILENRTMKVDQYKIIDYSFPTLELELSVGSGTYIRSIGYWLGRELGLGGILTQLRRIRIGQYDLQKIKLDQSLDEIKYSVLLP